MPIQPFTGVQGIEARKPQPEAQRALKRPQRAFTDHTGQRDYNAMFRAAHDYLSRYSPPQLSADYWIEAGNALNDTAAAHGNDPFLCDMLLAMFGEMEREYKIMTGNIETNAESEGTL